MRPHALAMAVLLALDLGAAAVEPEEGHKPLSTWNVRIDLQVVSIPTKPALQLVPELMKADTFPAAKARLQALLDSGEAEVLSWPFLEGVSGTRLETRSVEGIPKEAKFWPPSPPGKIEITPSMIEEQTKNFVFYAAMITPMVHVPIDFDTQEAGITVTGRATPNPDGKAFGVELEASLVDFEGIEPTIGARSERLGDLQILKPRFRMRKVSATLDLRNGGGQLVGSFIQQSAEPRMTLLLLSIQVTPIPPVPAFSESQ